MSKCSILCTGFHFSTFSLITRESRNETFLNLITKIATTMPTLVLLYDLFLGNSYSCSWGMGNYQPLMQVIMNYTDVLEIPPGNSELRFSEFTSGRYWCWLKLGRERSWVWLVKISSHTPASRSLCSYLLPHSSVMWHMVLCGLWMSLHEAVYPVRVGYSWLIHEDLGVCTACMSL